MPTGKLALLRAHGQRQQVLRPRPRLPLVQRGRQVLVKVPQPVRKLVLERHARPGLELQRVQLA